MLQLVIRWTDAVMVMVQRNIWVRERCQLWWEKCAFFTENEWFCNFRVQRQTFHYICDLLRPRLYRKSTQLRAAIPVEKRVALALYWFATGDCFRTIGHLFGVSKAIVWQCVHEVASGLKSLVCQHISIPTGERLNEMTCGFEERSGFPQCSGAIDGTHIPILSPRDNASDYSIGKAGIPSYFKQLLIIEAGKIVNIHQ